MILEAAVLNVRPGEAARFEAAMARARPLIEASPGFRGMELRRCIEEPERYLLLVRWDRLEDHMDGFRRSDRYAQWRAALHHFYDPSPAVWHYGDPL